MGKKRIRLGLKQLGVESDHCHSLAMPLGQDILDLFLSLVCSLGDNNSSYLVGLL